MEQNHYCCLCRTSCMDFQSLYDAKNGQCNEVYEITKKYFDTKLLAPPGKDKLVTIICLQCWHNIEDFHNYQKTVWQIQTELEDVKPKIRVVNLEQMTDPEEFIKLDDIIEINNDIPAANKLDIAHKLIPVSLTKSNVAINLKTSGICLEPATKLDNIAQKLIPVTLTKSNVAINLKTSGNCLEPATKLDNIAQKLIPVTLTKSNVAINLKTSGNCLEPATKLDIAQKLKPVTLTKSNVAINLKTSGICLEDLKKHSLAGSKFINDKLIAELKGNLECFICQQNWESYSLLYGHFKRKHPGKIFHVVCCKRKFYERFRLVLHLRQFHTKGEEENIYECKSCAATFSYYWSLRRHIRNKHSTQNQNSDKLEPEYTDISEKELPTVEFNASNDNETTNLTPTNPIQTSVKAMNLTDPLSTKDTKSSKFYKPLNFDNSISNFIADLECPICKAVFPYYSLLTKHFTKKHPKEKSHIICCENKLYDALKILIHIRNFHKNKSGISYRKMRSKKSLLQWRCKNCSRHFKTRYSLKSHRNYCDHEKFPPKRRVEKTKNQISDHATILSSIESVKIEDIFDLIIEESEEKDGDYLTSNLDSQNQIQHFNDIISYDKDAAIETNEDTFTYTVSNGEEIYELEVKQEKNEDFLHNSSSAEIPYSTLISNDNITESVLDIINVKDEEIIISNNFIAFQSNDNIKEAALDIIDIKGEDVLNSSECNVTAFESNQNDVIPDNIICHPNDSYYEDSNIKLNSSEVKQEKNEYFILNSSTHRSTNLNSNNILSHTNEFLDISASSNYMDSSIKLEFSEVKKEKKQYSIQNSSTEIVHNSLVFNKNIQQKSSIDIKDEDILISSDNETDNIFDNDIYESNSGSDSDYYYEHRSKSKQQIIMEEDNLIAKWTGDVKCPKCREKFAYYNSLDKHVRSKHPTEKFSIICCQLKFDNRQCIIEHIRNAHKDINQPIGQKSIKYTMQKLPINETSTQKPARSSFACSICDKVFKSERSLQGHIRQVHSDKRSEYHHHTCYCEKKLSAKASSSSANNVEAEHDIRTCCARKQKVLEDNALISRWLKKLTCRLCVRTFPSYSLLRSHFYYNHPGEKCSIICCKKNYYRLSEVLEHIRLHLDRFSFKCRHCQLPFSGTYSLTKHMRLVHNEMSVKHLQYPCDQCDKSYDYKYILTRHKNTFHANEV